jgi:hypothetical protein
MDYEKTFGKYAGRKLQESQEYYEPVTLISRKGKMKEVGKISNVEADLEMYLIAGWPSLVTPDAIVPCFLRPLWRGIPALSPFSFAPLRSRGFPRPKGQENCGAYAGRSKGRPLRDQIPGDGFVCSKITKPGDTPQCCRPRSASPSRF